jgi:hypothetical protein
VKHQVSRIKTKGVAVCRLGEVWYREKAGKQDSWRSLLYNPIERAIVVSPVDGRRISTFTIRTFFRVIRLYEAWCR